MPSDLAREFLMLLVTVDPIGTLSIFVGITAGVAARDRTRIAIRSVLIGGGVLVAFLVVGQLVLGLLGVGLAAFQLSGGIILFLFGLQMIFGTGAAGGDSHAEPGHDLAVFPLAIPSIASPGSILAVVVLTDNQRFTVTEQALTLGLLVAVLIITLAAMLFATMILRVIGEAGASTLIRVMGLILCGLATELVIDAVQIIFSVGPLYAPS